MLYNFRVDSKPDQFQGQYKGRQARVKAQLEGMVLYDVVAGDKVQVENCYVTQKAFNERYI